MSTGHSFKLCDDDWDLCVDSAGNIATCIEDEAIAQNVSNTIRLFTNDAWFEPERGIDHFNLDLGVRPLTNQVRARFIKAAVALPGVEAATVTDLTISEERELSGHIHVVTSNGGIADVVI